MTLTLNEVEQESGAYEIPGGQSGRLPTTFEAHSVSHPGIVGGRQHLAGLARVESDRLFDQNVLARRDGGHGLLVVQVYRSTDRDDVEVVALHEGPPVGAGVGDTQLLAGCANALGSARAQRRHLEGRNHAEGRGLDH
jgi:hypothetical protein